MTALHVVPWRERPLLPLQTASAIAGVSVASLYDFEKKGRLAFRRFAGRTLVESASLAALLDAAEPWKASERGAAARKSRVERSRKNWRR